MTARIALPTNSRTSVSRPSESVNSASTSPGTGNRSEQGYTDGKAQRVYAALDERIQYHGGGEKSQAIRSRVPERDGGKHEQSGSKCRQGRHEHSNRKTHTDEVWWVILRKCSPKLCLHKVSVFDDPLPDHCRRLVWVKISVWTHNCEFITNFAHERRTLILSADSLINM